MSQKLEIGNLNGGGLVLNWRCPSQCRHCLYGSGPHRSDGAPKSSSALDSFLPLLKSQAPRARWHIGGGEPFLDIPRLKRVISGMVKRGMVLEYVETNASWVKDSKQVRKILHDLEKCGLQCLLVSLSPFHAEFIPLKKTRMLIFEANDILPGGAFVWIQDFNNDLAEVDANQVLDFDEFLSKKGPNYPLELTQRYHLFPAGRAGRFLAQKGFSYPLQDLIPHAPCTERLSDTNHFHIDAQGTYIPGLCAGIGLPIEEVPGIIDLKKYPTLKFLSEGNLAGLLKMAQKKGFVPNSEYGSPCDLCTHIRVFLYRENHEEYPELKPHGFYDPRSLQAFC